MESDRFNLSTNILAEIEKGIMAAYLCTSALTLSEHKW
jgi:hypothetical protein